MLVIGLTGGIGSGKSTVANLFAQQQVPIIDTDIIARQVVEPGQDAYQQVLEQFGRDILNKDGHIDRQQLRNIVFNNSLKRQQLEAILHPAIRDEVTRELNQLNSAYCIIVIPLLFETNQYDFLDRVLVIDSPEDLQIQRAMQRDHLTEADIRKVLAAQISREARRNKADDIILNDRDLAHLESEVSKLHQIYLQLASSR